MSADKTGLKTAVKFAGIVLVLGGLAGCGDDGGDGGSSASDDATKDGFCKKRRYMSMYIRLTKLSPVGLIKFGSRSTNRNSLAIGLLVIMISLAFCHGSGLLDTNSRYFRSKGGRFFIGVLFDIVHSAQSS